jgi:hypothetical protein
MIDVQLFHTAVVDVCLFVIALASLNIMVAVMHRAHSKERDNDVETPEHSRQCR